MGGKVVTAFLAVALGCIAAAAQSEPLPAVPGQAAPAPAAPDVVPAEPDDAADATADSAEAASGPSQTLQVGDEQTATVVGEFASLKTVVAELCRRGRIDLRAFDALDRAVTVNLREVPMHAALRVLLSQENYLLGESGGGAAGGASRVAWLHVSGTQTGAATRASLRAMFNYDKPVPAPAAEPPPDSTELALKSLNDKLFSTDQKKEQFLATDASTLATSLQHYPDAPALVRRMLGENNDPQVVQKLTEVLSLID